MEVLHEKSRRLTTNETNGLLESIDCAISQSSTEFAARLGFDKAREEIDYLKRERDMREKFVSTLTHDLRTPLTAIKAAGELILKQADDQGMARTLAVRVIEAATRLDKMIRDLLDANHIRAGKPLPVKLGECELVSLVKNSIEELRTIYGDRFKLVAPEKLEGYWSSEGLRRVLENLLVNAVKYGESFEPVTIHVSELGDKICLSVHNFGKPIPKEEQLNLFGQFERSAGARHSGKQGWGIGLTLVRGVVESHGGSVRVESAPTEGTRFILEFPRDARREVILAA